jgi:hypothetical protein
MTTEIYVSTDIEADGPIPGPHSMLSIGSAAFVLRETNGRYEKVFLGGFSANLKPLLGAAGHPDTMAWWKTQPAAWDACQKDQEEPLEAMGRYCTWLQKLPGVNLLVPSGTSTNLVFVGYPAGFDFLFVYWYLMYFGGMSPFSFSAMDVKSYASAVLRLPYRGTTKRTMPKRWFSKKRHTHVAIDDAIEQGEMFMNMLCENLNPR